MGKNDIDAAMAVSAAMKKVQNTPEEIRLATRAICGARACEGPEDANLVFTYLGIAPKKEKVQDGTDREREEGHRSGGGSDHGDLGRYRLGGARA